MWDQLLLVLSDALKTRLLVLHFGDNNLTEGPAVHFISKIFIDLCIKFLARLSSPIQDPKAGRILPIFNSYCLRHSCYGLIYASQVGVAWAQNPKAS